MNRHKDNDEQSNKAIGMKHGQKKWREIRRKKTDIDMIRDSVKVIKIKSFRTFLLQALLLLSV